MADFDKSCVDVAELDEAEIRRVCAALGLGEVLSSQKLTNGGCAANYIVRLSAANDGAAEAVVLKACVAESAARAKELAVLQYKVLAALAKHGAAAPAPKSSLTTACVGTRGQAGHAMAMALLSGEAGNRLLRSGEADAPAVFGAIGRALAAAHAVPPPDGLPDVGAAGSDYIERYVRCEAPLEAHVGTVWRADEPTGFVAWAFAARRLGTARAVLADASLPRGLLHGDPYADNVLLDLETSQAALVDWEDSCIGPLAFDLACAAAGGCFSTADDTAAADVFPPPATLNAAALGSLLSCYAAARGGFGKAEAEALVDLTLCNALACALYRFYQFHTLDANAPAEAKRSYREMHAICLALEVPAVVAQMREVASAAVC